MTKINDEMNELMQKFETEKKSLDSHNQKLAEECRVLKNLSKDSSNKDKQLELEAQLKKVRCDLEGEIIFLKDQNKGRFFVCRFYFFFIF